MSKLLGSWEFPKYRVVVCFFLEMDRVHDYFMLQTPMAGWRGVLLACWRGVLLARCLASFCWPV